MTVVDPLILAFEQALDAQAKVQIDRAQGKVVVESSQPAEKIAAAIAAEGYQVQ